VTADNPYIKSLLETNPVRETVTGSIIQAQQLPPGSSGLDVGCGIGLQALALAEAVGPYGHVTGLDIDPEQLAFGENLVAQGGFAGRITFQEGAANRLPLHDHAFDWVWSADCVGYPAGDFAPALAELMRVVKPGGSIILLGWTSQQVLPGYALLEARLNATYSGYRPYLDGQRPEAHFLRAPQGMRRAGLENVTAQTFVGEVQSPLSEAERVALTALFAMLWINPTPVPASDDWQACLRLCRPGSPDFMLDQPDYYAFFTYTVFRGRVP
jgi:SAM-dependent methyltransferase